MNDKKYNLLPCPCGGEAVVNFYTTPYLSSQVECMECGDSTPLIGADTSYCAEEEAVKIWNQTVRCSPKICKCGAFPLIVVTEEGKANCVQVNCSGCGETGDAVSNGMFDIEDLKIWAIMLWNDDQRKRKWKVADLLKDMEDLS